jgi:hypothetical protein
MGGVTKKKSLKTEDYALILNSVWWKCCMMFACQFDNNLFALILCEGICHSNSKNESKDRYVQRATLGAGLQNRTPTRSGDRSWYEMS